MTDTEKMHVLIAEIKRCIDNGRKDCAVGKLAYLDYMLRASASPHPEQSEVSGLENIPEFSEPKFFLTRGAIGQWIVSWREGNRVLALAPPWDSEQIARNQCRVLNELFDGLPASASPYWQPISTAPKDQTVLLYGAYTSGALGLVQGAWNHGGAMHMPHWMGGIIRPTHWQPLPLPPSARPASLEPK